ncbi:MAG: phenylacetate--CoA ligase family protein [Proteobacteria bacterium]|nr:phenylacetate--CoA ligase family protein [Pseudomonadota bacterium]
MLETAVQFERLDALVVILQNVSAKPSELSNALKLAAHNNRLKAYQPKAAHPLQEVPPLESSEVRSSLPPHSDNLVVPTSEQFTVFQSGGTTGMPKTTLFSHSELEALDLPNARGFYACGLRAEDRVANLFAVGSLYMTFIHINRMLQNYGCVNFPFANNSLNEFVHTVVNQFKINVVTGVSSIVLSALREFESLGSEKLKIEKVFFGGEHLYDADKVEIKRKFGTNTILAPGYGTVDTWYIGYQCEETPSGVFHAHDDQCFIEIVNEEKQQAAEPNQVGMLYATAYPRKITPIVRYRVGDLAMWLERPCPCGRTTPLFKLFGRGDDVLRIGYDSVEYASIQECVLKVAGVSGTVQLVKSRKAGKDLLEIRVESEEPQQEFARLERELHKVIVESRPAFQMMIQKGLIEPLQVKIVPVNSIERNQRTGKLIRIREDIIS